MTKSRPPEDVEQLLSEREQQLSVAIRELEQRSRDVDRLIRWIEQLDAGLSAILNSSRWRIGNALGELRRKALFKPAEPAVPHNLDNLRRRFRAWQKNFERAKGQLGTIGTGDFRISEQGNHELSTAYSNDVRSAPLSTVLGRWRFEPAEHILEDLRDLRTVTVVVPIHNAYEDLRGCLASVVRNTTAPAELLLIDDASTDPRIAPLLAEYEELESVRVLTNEENSGFVRTVNRGISESRGDVILLNSDVEVTPRWLENLTLAAYADPRTATVTAVSDNAGAFSVPMIGCANDTPEKLSRDNTGRLVMQQSDQVYPPTPTGSGFCMYVKRAAIDEVGLLDAQSFPRGYGEENDFCMRAQKLGWNHVVDDTTFVFHKRMASFGSEKKVALEAGRKMLDELHPEYAQLAQAFVTSDDLKRVGTNVRVAYGDAEAGRVRAKPRVLFVLHQAGGGTHYTTRDLMGALADKYSPYVLTSDALRLRLFRYEGEGPLLVEEWSLRSNWQITEFSRPDYRAIIFALLVKYRFELVHIRHLMGHTFDLPEIASRLRIPVFLSFHDFYISCPTVHLIDDHGRHCGGICTPGYGQCQLPSALLEEVPALKHRWLKTWRQNVERMFDHVDAFVTTSLASREVYLRSLPGLHDRLFEVIEHGRNLEQEHLAAPPGEGPIKVLIPGVINAHKGAGFIRELKRLDAKERLELHFLGDVADELRNLGVVHGFYKREEFTERVREIKPSFMGIFSIWPETYCHTLTESWAAGVPVLASDIGTLRERIEAHGGGWLLDYEAPRRSYERIIEIAGDREEYARELERANLQGTRSVTEMADDYEELYESVLQKHRSFNSLPGG